MNPSNIIIDLSKINLTKKNIEEDAKQSKSHRILSNA